MSKAKQSNQMFLLTVNLVVRQVQGVQLDAAAERGGDGAGEPPEREVELPKPWTRACVRVCLHVRACVFVHAYIHIYIYL